MKSFFAIAIPVAIGMFAVTALPAQMENHITTSEVAPAFEIQTISETCYGEANGSVYAQSGNTHWSLDIYRNGALLNMCAVVNRDTFIHGLTMGCYMFIYNSGHGSPDTISKIISAPAKIISTCRVHYLIRPDEDAVSFINLSAGAVAFDWDFGDGSHSAEISPVHVYSRPGTYTVTLTASNLSACASVSTYIINIDPSDRTGMNYDRAQTRTGFLVESHDGNAHIANTNSNTIAQITVYSVTGLLIYSGSGNDNKFPYATPGIYTAHIVYTDGWQESKKVSLN